MRNGAIVCDHATMSFLSIGIKSPLYLNAIRKVFSSPSFLFQKKCRQTKDAPSLVCDLLFEHISNASFRIVRILLDTVFFSSSSCSYLSLAARRCAQ